MGKNSNIQWTTHTFSPWVGCTKVSPGCKHCYAEEYDKRVGGGTDPVDGVKRLRWGPSAKRIKTAPRNWNQPLKWNQAAREAGERHRVFCASLSDVFEDRPEVAGWRQDLFGLIDKTTSLDWLILTKRPENIEKLMPLYAKGIRPNVWLGTSVEDQQRADERIPVLAKIPAYVRFLSCEPLLERIVLPDVRGRIDWAIIGGESGKEARPFHVDWVADLLEQCRDQGMVPFVKQLGAKPVFSDGPRTLVDEAGGDMAEWPAEIRMRMFPVPP